MHPTCVCTSAPAARVKVTLSRRVGDMALTFPFGQSQGSLLTQLQLSSMSLSGEPIIFFET